MIGLEEGVLPHARARGNINELEEERRLCFVGITRAQEHLILSRAAYRTIRGLRERTVTSPFLAEMPREKLDIIDRTELPGAGERAFERDIAVGETEILKRRYPKGQLVRHPQYGLGRVIEVTEGGPQTTRAIVQFNEDVGRKTFILQMARLEPVVR
jgi:DNA helicase-2/ATP-dependent DNA helicase PcrA